MQMEIIITLCLPFIKNYNPEHFNDSTPPTHPHLPQKKKSQD